MKTNSPVDQIHCRAGWRIFSIPALLGLTLALQPAAAMEKGEYPAPALDKFQPAGESEADVNGDGVNESLIRRYVSEAGIVVFSLSTGDRLWAWSMAATEGEALDPSKSYVIRDSNCDGVFDEKYGAQEDFAIPACVK
jgi:hypothetical protein